MRGIRPASALLLLVAPPGKRTLTVPAAIAKSQGQSAPRFSALVAARRQWFHRSAKTP